MYIWFYGYMYLWFYVYMYLWVYVKCLVLTIKNIYEMKTFSYQKLLYYLYYCDIIFM